MTNNVMKRLLGLDVGTKRIGTAFAEVESMVVTPNRTFDRGGGKAEKAILSLIKEKNVSLVVVGYPISALGELTDQCCDIDSFCNRLRKRSEVQIVYEDEYLTSEEAAESLKLKGKNREQIRKSGIIDSIAASLILRRYLARGFDRSSD